MSGLPARPAGARAAILTVDDDAGGSRAVARDLGRRYGETYRIMRTDSGAGGLDALREMKLRGDDAAVLLADYRMPQMSGLQFLEQAMDHYLLRPWDPPEEEFYPVVDAQLEAWLTERALPVVITTDGTLAIQPTDPGLAGLVGLTMSPVGDFYDLVVIGG